MVLNEDWKEQLADGSMYLSHSELPIDFSPYGLGEFTLGVVTSIPLEAGLKIDWEIGPHKRQLKVLSSKPFNSGKYNLRLAMIERDIAIPELLGIRSPDREGFARAWPESSRLQSARFDLEESCPIHLNTFGIQESFQFNIVNISQTGLLVERPSRLPQSAPFIKSTLLEAVINPSETAIFAPTGGPHNFLAKVAWTSWGEDYSGHFIQRYGLFIIQQEDVDNRWNRWVQSIEMKHIHGGDWSVSA